MGGEIHFAEVVAGRKIRVVVFAVGNPGHGIDEGHGFVKSFKFKALGYSCCIITQHPPGDLAHRGLSFLAVHGGYAAFTGLAVAVG